MDYNIQIYNPEYFTQVLDLLKYLLGNNHDNNRDYFKWKYYENPISEFPHGIIVLYKGKVVGFKGYCPLLFQVKGKSNNILALIPGDTCVHPDHRRKGLSIAMGEKASEEYSEKYHFFLNLTASRNSVPGYLKRGFHPLTSKTYLTKSNIVGFIKYLYLVKNQSKTTNSKIRDGIFDDIIVSQQSKLKEMQILKEGEKISNNKIILFQDDKFLRWRFSNKRDSYVFLYSIEKELLKGYIVFRLSTNKQRGFIIDYSGDNKTVEEILKFTIKARFFDVLSVYHFNLLDNIRQKVQDLGFKKNSLFRLIERKTNGEWPLLIRPIKKNYIEKDFFVDGLDLRKAENWYFKGIGYDDI